MYLGVHFLSDVLAAYAAGLAWLSLCVVASSVGPAAAAAIGARLNRPASHTAQPHAHGTEPGVGSRGAVTRVAVPSLGCTGPESATSRR